MKSHLLIMLDQQLVIHSGVQQRVKMLIQLLLKPVESLDMQKTMVNGIVLITLKKLNRVILEMDMTLIGEMVKK